MVKKTDAEVNTYFDGKPDWFRGYAETIAKYVVENQLTVEDGRPFMPVQSPMSTHFSTCGIGEIWDTDEETSMESSFQTFGNGDYAASFVSATVSCKCGEYHRVAASVSSNISDIISSTLRWS